jgi:hypothetical protein
MAIPTATYPTTPQFARSPIFITLTKGAGGTDGLIDATLTLRIFAGDSTTSPAIDYTLYKTSINDAPITFEISELIREKIISVLKQSSTNSYQNGTTEAVWCKFSLSSNYVNAGTPASGVIVNNASWLNTDGWLSFTQHTGTTTGRMVTNRTLYTANGSQYVLSAYAPSRIYFFYRNIGASWTNVANYTPGTTSASRIAYIPYDRVNASTFSGLGLNETFQVGFGQDSATPSVVYTVSEICEPKYDPVRLTFVNKFGVTDHLTFFKVSTEDASFTEETYMPQLSVSATTAANVAQALQYRKFNVNSREVITLNTGWVDENYADIIKEVMLSEKISLNYEGVEFTANVVRDSVRYQKSINDRNINYTMAFEIAWDILNSIR